MTKLQRGPVSRSVPLTDSFTVGQGTAPVKPAALAGQPTEILGINIMCKTDSAESIFVGTQTAQYREVTAGSTQTLNIVDLSTVYVRSAGGAGTYDWIAGT